MERSRMSGRTFAGFIGAALLAALGLLGPLNAQEDERELPSELLGQPAKGWFDPKSCARPPGARIHVLVGQAVLAVPTDNVRAMMPSRISQMRAVAGKIVARIGRTAGCPETPFPAAAVSLMGLKGVRSGMLVITATPDNKAAFEAQLVKIRDSGACTSAGPGLIRCEGNRTTPSGRERVAYVMAVDPAVRQASGGPLRALCILEPVQRCNVVDDLDGGVRFDSVIAGPLTLEKVRQVDAEGRSFVESLWVR